MTAAPRPRGRRPDAPARRPPGGGARTAARDDGGRSRALALLLAVDRGRNAGELLVADEVFLTGTAAEITPVRQVDLHTIGRGEPGPITRGLQKAYFELVRGRGPAPAHWRTSFGALVR